MTYKRNIQKKHGISQQRSSVTDNCQSPSCVSYGTDRNSPSLAMVYGVTQYWKNIDDGCKGFERGTIFEELYKPFMGDKCRNGGCRR